MQLFISNSTKRAGPMFLSLYVLLEPQAVLSFACRLHNIMVSAFVFCFGISVQTKVVQPFHETSLCSVYIFSYSWFQQKRNISLQSLWFPIDSDCFVSALSYKFIVAHVVSDSQSQSLLTLTLYFYQFICLCHPPPPYSL